MCFWGSSNEEVQLLVVSTPVSIFCYINLLFFTLLNYQHKNIILRPTKKTGLFLDIRKQGLIQRWMYSGAYTQFCDSLKGTILPFFSKLGGVFIILILQEFVFFFFENWFHLEINLTSLFDDQLKMILCTFGSTSKNNVVYFPFK